MVFISYRASNSPRPRDGKERKTVEHFEKLHRPGSQITGGDKEPWFSWLDGATIPPYGEREETFFHVEFGGKRRMEIRFLYPLSFSSAKQGGELFAQRTREREGEL